MANPTTAWDEVSLTVAASGTQSNWVAVGNPNELGLFVPALSPSATVTVKVARDASGTGAAGLVDKAGTAILVLASGAGGIAVSSNEMGAVLGYPFVSVVLGTATTGAVVFRLQRKITADSPYA
jgi:hypothetical protein